MTGQSPLPEGCRFHIWPRYRVRFHGRWVRLSDGEGEILLLLMSKPGQVFSTQEIAAEVYWHRPDGGPSRAVRVIPKQIFDMRAKFRKVGIDLLLKSPVTKMGYVFRGMEMIERPAHPARERRQLVAAE